MNIEHLSSFLKVAKKNTYASESAKKVESQRLKSKDYEYSEGNFLYHDTYFGGTNFIGEEIVYENDNPVWGMNYNGYVLDKNVTEVEIDKSLRGALKQDSGDLIPVRGPKYYKVENLEYKNKIEGDLTKFEGKEEVYKDNKLIYSALFHGGLIS
ncbi:MAG: DUF5680 domain-containing protein [Candidatus Paceibacterota bacterium]